MAVLGSQRYRRHSKEFKEEAVRMVVEQGLRKAEVARDLGVSPSLLDEWIGKSERTAKRSNSKDKERIRQLERELSRVSEERDILKKAITYFAKEKP